MISSEKRQKEFIEKLTALLKESGAELQVSDDGRNYGMHKGICTIAMDSVYNELTDELEKDFCEFKLPTYMP